MKVRHLKSYKIYGFLGSLDLFLFFFNIFLFLGHARRNHFATSQTGPLSKREFEIAFPIHK